MESLEYNIQKTRNKHRKQRNFVRRITLAVFILFFILFLRHLYLKPFKSTVDIEILNALFSNKEYILSEVEKQIKDKNFYQISPIQVSHYLIKNCKHLSNVVIRKYIFPKYKIIVHLDEKEIWANVVIPDESKKNYFACNDGSLALPLCLCIEMLPKDLIDVEINVPDALNQDELVILKDALSVIEKDYGIVLDKVTLTSEKKIEILCKNGLLIKAGEINKNLPKTIQKLENTLAVIEEKQYEVDYIDLTLEQNIVVKKASKKDGKKGSLVRSLFDFKE